MGGGMREKEREGERERGRTEEKNSALTEEETRLTESKAAGEEEQKKTNALFVKVDPVVVLTTGVTATTRMLAVLANAAVTVAHMTLQTPTWTRQRPAMKTT